MVKSLYMALILTLVAFTALPVKAEDYKALEWTDLLPEEDLKKMEQLPEISHEGGEAPAGGALNQPLAIRTPQQRHGTKY
ncbi:hypothetical protein [Rheinheimera sp. KL1]|uniref:hypothetical protein n=1 Tax=Rheinheimera sp. KL1 TaxID=1635005 RepID=UPI000AD5887C|nr:hypothetical protein [Rheinheimera sp. KL1]